MGVASGRSLRRQTYPSVCSRGRAGGSLPPLAEAVEHPCSLVLPAGLSGGGSPLSIAFFGRNRHSLLIDVGLKKPRPVAVELDHASTEVARVELMVNQGQHLGELHSLIFIKRQVIDANLIDADLARPQQIEPDTQRLKPLRRQVVDLQDNLRPL